MRVPSGSTTRYLYFVALDATDLKTRETGLSSFTVYRSRNGGAAAAMSTPTINETDVTNMAGVYELLMDEDTTLDAGDDEQEMVVHITHAGMSPVTRAIEIYRPKVTEGQTVTASGGALRANDADGASITAASQAGAAAALEAAITLPGQEAPTATPSIKSAIAYLFKALRNKKTQTATEFTLFADDGTTPDQQATVSDDGTTTTIGELGSGA